MAPWVLVAADQVVGVALAVSGSVVLLRGKERRIGVLLWLASATWFAGSLVGNLAFLHRGPMVQLHLSYPTGRLHRWPARVAVGAAYLWAVGEGFGSEPAVTAGLATLVALAAADGYRRTTGPTRRASRPGFVAALLFAAILGLSAANRLVGLDADFATALTYDLVMVVVAVWLATDLLRGGWTEATLADLVTQLGGSPEAAGLEAELRRALGDPGLVVGYWDPKVEGYVDTLGAPVEYAGRGVTRVEDEGRPVAVIVHDPALRADPALLEGAVGAVRLSVSNIRLRAEIRDRVTQLAVARRHTVEAADAQRLALQAELAAGPEAELARAARALASTDGAAWARGDLGRVREAIDAAGVELHRFAQGLRPEVLEAEGLPAAVDQLAARAAVPVMATVRVARLPAAVEAALYFVCSEAVTNASKHARATRIILEVRHQQAEVVATIADDGIGGADPTGSGLRGLTDRIAALGGVLTVADLPMGGTLVTARIPAGGR